jgi:hypothetical protein
MARVALIATAAFVAGCFSDPLEHFPRLDLTTGPPAPPSTIVVGEKAVLRLEGGSGPHGWDDVTLRFDVFPPGAEVRGAWVRTVRRERVDEGSATVTQVEGTQRYVVSWRSRLDFVPNPPSSVHDATVVWLGPVCVERACETFVLDDEDWPRSGPSP